MPPKWRVNTRLLETDLTQSTRCLSLWSCSWHQRASQSSALVCQLQLLTVTKTCFPGSRPLARTQWCPFFKPSMPRTVAVIAVQWLDQLSGDENINRFILWKTSFEERSENRFPPSTHLEARVSLLQSSSQCDDCPSRSSRCLARRVRRAGIRSLQIHAVREINCRNFRLELR